MSYFLIVLFSLINLVYSVPPEYCLRPLNTSDCKTKPTPVFTYYKPGSRCEIETWRGCPTFNKFPNEYACSDLCIFRFGVEEPYHARVQPVEDIQDFNHNYQKLQIKPFKISSEIIDLPQICLGEFNREKCSDTFRMMFTYDRESRQCVQKAWYLCASSNIYKNKNECTKTCLDPLKNNFWEQLSHKPVEQIRKLNYILDDIVGNIVVSDDDKEVDENRKDTFIGTETNSNKKAEMDLEKTDELNENMRGTLKVDIQNTSEEQKTSAVNDATTENNVKNTEIEDETTELKVGTTKKEVETTETHVETKSKKVKPTSTSEEQKTSAVNDATTENNVKNTEIEVETTELKVGTTKKEVETTETHVETKAKEVKPTEKEVEGASIKPETTKEPQTTEIIDTTYTEAETKTDPPVTIDKGIATEVMILLDDYEGVF